MEKQYNMLTGSELREPKGYQSITKVKCNHTGAVLKVRRISDELPLYPETDILTLIKNLEGTEIEKVVETLGSLKGVTSVEILDSEGLGLIVEF